MQTQLDQQQFGQIANMPSIANQTGASDSSLTTSDFMFNDDLMQDFGAATGHSDPVLFDDQLVPDMQNLPW